MSRVLRVACCVLRAACFGRVSHRQGGKVPHQDGGWDGVHACVLRAASWRMLPSQGRRLGSPACISFPMLLPHRDGGGVYHRDLGRGAK